MLNEFEVKVNRFLKSFSDELDISETNFEKAKERYKSVGEWLERPDSKIKDYAPQIYPQGSFRLGTVVKPITDKDDYDIDLVCELDISKTKITQSELKTLFGEELILYTERYNMNSKPTEGKRCWKLEYADGIKFHMDILPCVPEDEEYKKRLQNLGVSKEWAQHAIALTDTRNDYYNVISKAWESSNPKGYAKWFETRMIVAAEPERRLLVEKGVYAKIDDVPAFQWKTPLQRSIQILKRHRDIMFENDLDNKPISIILSTLSGHSYNNEININEALLNILSNMLRFIENGIDGPWLKNPVNPAENFAEKWTDHPEKERAFHKWYTQAQNDFKYAIESGKVEKFTEILKPKLGSNLFEKIGTKTFVITTPALNISGTDNPTRVPIKSPNKPWGNFD